MEIAELTALLTSEGLRLLDEVPPIEDASDALRVVSRLRTAGHAPDLVAAVVTQVRLREKAKAKFGPFAAAMLFTRAGLEQATRMPVAAVHAQRLRRAGVASVADLGCGIGGDALAFAAAGLQVTAVDADEVTAGIAAYNLAPFQTEARVLHAQAQDVDLSGVDAVWLDPARRTAGHAETSRVAASEYSPPLDWAFGLSATHAVGVKLGPGHDRDELPADAETQWVSVDGDVVETAVWTGRLARDGVRRAALVLRGDDVHEITGTADAEDAEVVDLGAYLHEPDGAVIRARLIGDVARTLDAGMLADGIAYLTGDAAVTSPFVTTFRVTDQLPLDVKTLTKALRARGIGRLEIKKRGVDIDPAAFRKRLGLRGSAAATLFLTRVGGRRAALLAERV